MRWADDTHFAHIRQAEGRGLVVSLLGDATVLASVQDAVAFAGLDHLRVTGAGACLDAIGNLKPDLIVTREADTGASREAFVETVTRAKRTETLPVLFLDDAEPQGSALLHMPGDTGLAAAFMLIRGILRRERPSVFRGLRHGGGCVLDEPGFRITCGARSHDLSKGELCLLGPFFDAPGFVLDRLTLERLAYGTSHYASGNRQIDFYLNKLRRGLKAALGTDPIRSVRGKGYVLDD